MPLHDHCRPPMSEHLAFETLHTIWVAEIAGRLNERWLRQPFRARGTSRSGSEFEIDIATQEHRRPAETNGSGPAVTTLIETWAPPAAHAVGRAVFPDVIEVRVFEGPSSWYLVGAIEIISRSNKHSPGRRDAFLRMCATFLQSGVSLVLIDVVTDRHANLHNDLIDLLRIPADRLPDASHLYASAFRPVVREGRDEIDVWCSECRVGDDLPTMPLRLTGDLFVPVEFEWAYQETWRRNEMR